jgi:hypothetical protein
MLAALSPNGGFGKDARREIAVPPGSTATEISKITFDDQGRMLIAECAGPTGAFDFEALTPEGTGRVLRYAIVGAADDGTPIWQPVPDEYAIGFPRDLRNGAGGVAIALRMQDPDGSRYLAFHHRPLGEVGPNGKSRALSIAKELGFDPRARRPTKRTSSALGAPVRVTLVEGGGGAPRVRRS